MIVNAAGTLMQRHASLSPYLRGQRTVTQPRLTSKSRIPFPGSASKSFLAAPPAGAAINDGDDPRADHCAAAGDAEAAALGAKEVTVRNVKTDRGTPIGWLALWRNSRCGAEWAETSYVDPHLYPVTLEAHRPSDGATVVEHVVVNLPDDPVIGSLLLTAPGCV